MEFFIIFFIWLVLGSTTAYLASRKGRDPLVWSIAIMLVGVAGLLFSLIGLLILLSLPPVTDKDESTSEEPDLSPTLVAPELTWERQSWYYFNAKKERLGPLSSDQLKLALKAKELQPESFIWTEGMSGWKKLKEVPNLLSWLENRG